MGVNITASESACAQVIEHPKTGVGEEAIDPRKHRGPQVIKTYHKELIYGNERRRKMHLSHSETMLLEHDGEVHATLQLINTDYDKDLQEEDKIKAIPLRIDSKLQDEASAKLAAIYSSSST